MTQPRDNETPQVPEELWELLRLHADICKVLANDRRLAIVWVLSHGEASVGEIAEALDVPIHNVSQHLKVMKSAGVVSTSKRGQSVYCSLTNLKIVQGCSMIREALVEIYRAQGTFIDVDKDVFRHGSPVMQEAVRETKS